MNTSEVTTLDQWRKLSERVGGNLFQDQRKLQSMRKIDRTFGSEVPWEKFCDLVSAEIEGKFIIAPTGKGKGLPEGTLPLTCPNKGGEE
ncbi:hypothetical protein [uncultured Sulfitobacter sp.]|uniref:hypothetical protein n=1 Tax=uncultured Sulfitobacter sp. TaxID=191468 RepID=UPI0025929EFC|nr:hypothetical protein [uncultured Sulfitobacter sp.]